MTVSIGLVIPIYIRSARDLVNLEITLKSVEKLQRLPDQIVITDDSEISHFQSTMEILSNFHGLGFIYKKNLGTKGISANSNNGISELTTDYVHCLHQDDIIIHEDLYLRILSVLKKRELLWVLLGGTADGHRIIPDLVNGLLPTEALCGLNTIGGPSCVIFPNIPSLRFDTRFNMLCDVAFFFNAQSELGAPILFTNSEIHYGMGEWQEQRRITEKDVLSEALKLTFSYSHFLNNCVFRVFRYRKRFEVKIRALWILRGANKSWPVRWIIQLAIVLIFLRLKAAGVGRKLIDSFVQ